MVFAMWVLIFLSMLNGALYRMVVSHMKVSKRVRQRIFCPYIAKSAYYHASVQRKMDLTSGYDTLYELRTEREAALATGKYIYSMEDEESKININTSSPEVLSRLPGLNEELATNIVASSMRPFRAKEELLLIEGINEKIFGKFKDLITVAGKGWVNINTASGNVFSALGMGDGLIAIIKDYRGDSEGREVNEESYVFKSVETIIEDLRSVRGLFQEQEKLVLELIGREALQVSGTAFSLRVKTEVLKKSARNYTIVMEDGKIKDWSEN